ncbi:MAG: UvrD-helicase domain-containing protein [Planctomycetota bacterium]|nr:UvrD-helicase domain-containing protein [Planctomycetota bacterium]
MSKLLEGLNAEQRAAVVATEGSVLVLAGAGSGKTRVITVRIAHLLEKGVAPGNILAMTFTNKAAREMRERVGKLVGKDRAEQLFVGTFHSFCLNALREHGAHIGLGGGFTICDASDQVSTVRGVMRELRVMDAKVQPAQLQSRISLMKNRLVDPDSLLGKATTDEDELVARAYKQYDEQLRRSKTLDFDDLLLYTLRLLAKKEVREGYARRFRYVMVDEYQDTNGPQYEIVKAIAGAHRNLCVVGDDDQSIYGWRGADVTKILSFERDFPGAKVVRLETNYRSTAQILGAANRVIANNPKRLGKTLRSAFGDGAPVSAVVLKDDDEEADHIAREIKHLVDRREAKFGQFAVLFRASALARAFETQFRARAIPYVLVGGMSYFDRKEVRDVMAYLKLGVAPEDEVSLLRVINCPPRGVGKASLDKALEHATAHGVTLAKAFEADSIPGVPDTAIHAVRDFRKLVATAAHASESLALPQRIERLLDAVGYKNEIERLYPDELTRTQRWTAVTELLELADRHQRKNRNASFATFLQDLTLEANDDGDDGEHKKDVVTLMTLHAAKGLEFPRVYLVGVEEGLLPHLRSVAEDTVEEERRLMYVGITRAQRNLTISYTQERVKFGKAQPSMPSRFLYEIKGVPPPEGWVAAGQPTPTQVVRAAGARGGIRAAIKARQRETKKRVKGAGAARAALGAQAEKAAPDLERAETPKKRRAKRAGS